MTGSCVCRDSPTYLLCRETSHLLLAYRETTRTGRPQLVRAVFFFCESSLLSRPRLVRAVFFFCESSLLSRPRLVRAVFFFCESSLLRTKTTVPTKGHAPQYLLTYLCKYVVSKLLTYYLLMLHTALLSTNLSTCAPMQPKREPS